MERQGTAFVPPVLSGSRRNRRNYQREYLHAPSKVLLQYLDAVEQLSSEHRHPESPRAGEFRSTVPPEEHPRHA